MPAPLKDKIEAERRMRELLASEGLPQRRLSAAVGGSTQDPLLLVAHAHVDPALAFRTGLDHVTSVHPWYVRRESSPTWPDLMP
jgi:hypothetical protein